MATSRHNAGLALFGKARRNILALLFGHADNAYYFSEIVKSAATGVSQVQLELKRLTDAGLLLREKRANQVYFRANPGAPIFEDLKNIVVKTFGVAAVVSVALQPFQNRIDVAFIYGSVARGEETAASDLDLLIIGSVTFAETVDAMRSPEQVLRREINATVFPVREFASRTSRGDHFLENVLQDAKIFLIGDERDLDRLAEERRPQSAQTQRARAKKATRTRRPLSRR